MTKSKYKIYYKGLDIAMDLMQQKVLVQKELDEFLDWLHPQPWHGGVYAHKLDIYEYTKTVASPEAYFVVEFYYNENYERYPDDRIYAVYCYPFTKEIMHVAVSQYLKNISVKFHPEILRYFDRRGYHVAENHQKVTGEHIEDWYDEI